MQLSVGDAVGNLQQICENTHREYEEELGEVLTKHCHSHPRTRL